jgi:hypothetical protein
VVLDDAGARTMDGASPAFDLVDGLIVTARGRRCRRHDPSQVLISRRAGPGTFVGKLPLWASMK